MPRQREYLSRSTAARQLGVSVQRVSELSHSRRLGKQIAGHWIYTTAELDAYCQERDAHPKGGRPRAAGKNVQHHAEGAEHFDVQQ